MKPRNTRPTIRLSKDEIEAFYSSLDSTGILNYSQAQKHCVLVYPVLSKLNEDLISRLDSLSKQLNTISAKLEEIENNQNDISRSIKLGN